MYICNLVYIGTTGVRRYLKQNWRMFFLYFTSICLPGLRHMVTQRSSLFSPNVWRSLSISYYDILYYFIYDHEGCFWVQRLWDRERRICIWLSPLPPMSRVIHHHPWQILWAHPQNGAGPPTAYPLCRELK